MPWARKHKQCVVCGSTAHKHYSRGWCKPCYQRQWAIDNAEHLQSYKHEWYEQSKSRVDYKAKSRKQKNGKTGEAMLRNRRARCALCGSREDLTIHHKDRKGHNVPEKMRNNARSNLDVLCRKCHGSLHSRITGWSRKHAACLDCGKTDRRHQAHGYCSGCYWKHYGPHAKTASE